MAKILDKQIPWLLLLKDFKQEANEEEAQQLEKWRSETSNEELYAELKCLWLSLLEERITKETEISSRTDVLWQRMEKQISLKQQPTTQRRMFHIWWSAAVAVIMFVVGWTLSLFLQKESEAVVLQTYTALNGKTKIMLPDSSSVWLNAGTTLSCSTEKWKFERTVHLDGEAFFEVQKDRRPFIVKTKELDVKVYGTSFNVSAVETQTDVKVSLVEGSVAVNRKEETSLIKPGEMAVYSKRTGKLTTEEVDATLESMWANETIRLERKSLPELVKYLERWYNVKILLDSSVSDDHAYTFTIKDEPLDEILRLMSRINPIRYEFKENNIVVITK